MRPSGVVRLLPAMIVMTVGAMLPSSAADESFLTRETPVPDPAADASRALFLTDPSAAHATPDYTAGGLETDKVAACRVDAIRLGGAAGDAFVGPTCNNDNTYRTCFYASGQDLPASNPDYRLRLNGVDYPVAFTQLLDSSNVVVCGTGLPLRASGVDVVVQVAAGCSREARDLYNAPRRCPEPCDPDTIRVGGQAGDAFIGPTCNNDGAYRTCLYVGGRNLPSNASAYAFRFDGVAFPVVFSQALSSSQVVMCASGLPPGARAVDATVQLAGDCTLTRRDIYDAPSSCPGTACSIGDIRLGGQPGDAFIGPTCNSDRTYRSCYYLNGVSLPENNPAYEIKVDGVAYPIAFTQLLDSSRVVMCATGLPTGARNVDVFARVGPICSYAKPNLYDAPADCLAGSCNISDIRTGGAPGDAFIGPTCSGDGTYRSCFYASGSVLPADNPAYTIRLDGVGYPVAFTQQLSDSQVVVCTNGLPPGATRVDTYLRLATNCEREADRLFQPPPACAKQSGRSLGGSQQWDLQMWRKPDGCADAGEAFRSQPGATDGCADRWMQAPD